MNQTNWRPSEQTKRWWLGSRCVLVLFPGFYSNTWNVADPGWFDRRAHDNEGLIVGRLVKSRQDGILSAGEFPGAGVPDRRDYYRPELIEKQFSTYLEGGTFDVYFPYMSLHGGQGMVFSALDAVLPLSPGDKLSLFRALTGLLSAIALSTIVAWFYLELGEWAAISVAVSMVFARWLTVSGRNLWWNLWVFYLSMLLAMYVPRRNAARTNRPPLVLGFLVFASVLVKCFINRYEYITTTIIMLLVPLVYYGVRDRWRPGRIGELASSATFASGAAVLTSLGALSLQIWTVRSSITDGGAT